MNRLTIISFTSLFFLSLSFVLFVSSASAQATSCWVTKVGNPVGDPPAFPAECATSIPGVDCTGAACAFKFIVDYPSLSLCSRWGDPRDGGRRKHMGVDLCAPANTPIRALEDGVVKDTDYDYGCGNIVKLYDVNNRASLHCHLINKSTIPKNTPVTQGTIIGYVGHTGANSSPTDHLHYQIKNPGPYESSVQYENPEVVLRNWPNY